MKSVVTFIPETIIYRALHLEELTKISLSGILKEMMLTELAQTFHSQSETLPDITFSSQFLIMWT